MSWVGWALACALGAGIVDLLTKRVLQETDPGVVGLARLGFAVLAVIVPLWRAGGIPTSAPFWGTMLIAIPLELAAFVLMLTALRTAPLSETIPFLSMSPLFTVLASWLILGERVTWWGLLGICAIGAGGYILYGHEMRHGYLGPVRAMGRSRGTRLMILVACIYSVTATLGKRAIQLSSAAAFPGTYYLVMVAGFVLLQGPRRCQPASVVQAIRRRPGLLMGLGLIDGLTFLIHSVGIRLAPVAYFIGIKRLSTVFSLVVGGVIFREERVHLRVAGAICMVAGAVLLTLKP